MTALERIARAIFFDMNSIMHDHEAHWRNANQAIWISNARAALTALREPDEAMIQAGVDVALSTSVGGAGSWHAYVAKLLQAAIDAAIQEGQ